MNKNIMLLRSDATVFYYFSLGLLNEIISKSNFLTLKIMPSFDSIEFLSVSISDYSYDWEYLSWYQKKDFDLYFDDPSAIGQYRYQVLKPNPTLYRSVGNINIENYIKTNRLINSDLLPKISDEISEIAIDGVQFELIIQQKNIFSWNTSIPVQYSILNEIIDEVTLNLALGRELAIQMIK